MKQLHRFSTIIVFIFLTLHFANHLIGLEGVDAYLAFTNVARLIYRHPIVEAVVLLAFVVQMISGFAMCRKAWEVKKDFVSRLYVVSGLYLALFVLVHIVLIAFGRFIVNEDTGFYYIAGSMLNEPQKYFFLPFYGLGIFSLFAHIGCALFRSMSVHQKTAAYILLFCVCALGAFIGYVIIMIMTGQYYAVTLPQDPQQIAYM